MIQDPTAILVPPDTYVRLFEALRRFYAGLDVKNDKVCAAWERRAEGQAVAASTTGITRACRAWDTYRVGYLGFSSAFPLFFSFPTHHTCAESKGWNALISGDLHRFPFAFFICEGLAGWRPFGDNTKGTQI